MINLFYNILGGDKVKVCKYCHTECDEQTKSCPSCGSNDFNHKCANCGTEYTSAFCPNCGIKFDAKKHICPTCGNSFYTNACPTCGYTINKSTPKVKENPTSNTTSSTVYMSTKPKKKKNIWATILLWLFFFPIMVFVAIWKSKMSQKTKIILTVILAVIFLIMGLGSPSEGTSNNTNTNTNISQPEQNIINSQSQQEESSQVEENNIQSNVYFESDSIVNKFFADYNEIATIPISADMIEQGNIKTKALVYGDAFNLEVINSQQGTLFVSIGSTPENENTALFTIFSDCLKAKKSFTDEEVLEVWNYLHESGYMVENYEYNGVVITYIPSVELSWGVNDPRIDLLF